MVHRIREAHEPLRSQAGESGIAFEEKRNKVLAMNKTVEEPVARATITADSEL
jgi:hypothetical protein